MGCALALLCLPVQAQMFEEPTLNAAYRAAQWPVLAQAEARLAAAPDDAQAVLAVALAAVQTNDAGRRRSAISHAQTCIERQPQAAPCHYALGVTLGVQAMSEGMLKMAGNAGRVRGALMKALELAPGWFAARSAAVEFYLLAPGLLGGSEQRAAELAAAAPQGAQVQALRARVLLQQRSADAAEQALQLLAPLGSATAAASDLAEDVNGLRQAATVLLVNERRFDTARPHVERMLREQPDEAMGPYMMGRLLSESGDHAQGLPQFEASARLRGADQLPIDYRSGIALQALGREAAARAALKRFVDRGKGNSKSLADARDRLGRLGG